MHQHILIQRVQLCSSPVQSTSARLLTIFRRHLIFFCNPIYGHADARLLFVYLDMCVSGHMHVHHVCAGWKKAPSYEGHEICNVGAGNGSQALCKDSKCSSKTLFRPCYHLLNSKPNVTQGQSSMTDFCHAWLLKAPHWRNVQCPSHRLTGWWGTVIIN